MMKFIVTTVVFLLLLSLSYADEVATDKQTHKRELSEEEVDRVIGRMGELEELPEGFRFTDAEAKIWQTNHLEKTKPPTSLYYEFTKSGSFEEGFTDSIFLKILEENEDGSKNVDMTFFTEERAQTISSENVTQVKGNPVIGIYMQGDIYEMNRLTDGHWRHFQKRIKMSLRNNAVVKPIKITFNGKEYNAEKIIFSPYLDDPKRSMYEKFSNKVYEIILSPDLPGSLYQLKTVILDQSKEDNKPLIEEVLTLVDIKES